jgi:putative tryptophan/tyrosine transport system substrate-binding protein
MDRHQTRIAARPIADRVSRRHAVVALLGLGVGLSGALPLRAGAQSAGKVYRVGLILTVSAKEIAHIVKAFDDALRELGYVAGKNLAFERRFAEGRQERLPALAAELVKLQPDLIVTGSNPVVAAVKKETTTIPIVMAVSRDPVGAGFIANLARPGGNITGLANDPAPEIHAKSLEFLKEAVPRATRVALLWNPLDPGAQSYRTVVETAAHKMDVTIRVVEIRGQSDIAEAFASIGRERTDGILVLQDPITFSARNQVVQLAAKDRLPAVYAQREFVEAGGLMSYGVNIASQFRHAAVYVDKILKGAKPGDLPVEQPTKFELVINLKTAKALGLTIPRSLLLRADEVIQ